MLPTPRIQDLLHTRLNRMLPTPQARDHKNSNTTKEITPRMRRKLEQGWTIDLNDRIAITPAVEDATVGVINHAVPIVLQGKTEKIINVVLNNMVTSNSWGSRLVFLQWTTRPLYSILRKNGSGKDGKKQFSLLYQLTPSPINNSQSELLPTPNTMEGLEPKSKESILAYNAKCRPGRSYATSNLRERLAHGKMEKEMGMLPTPTSQDGKQGIASDWQKKNWKGLLNVEIAKRIDKMLPTPNTTDGQNHMDTSPRHTPSLQTILADKLLPTPRSEEGSQGEGAAKAFADAGFTQPTSRNGKQRTKGGNTYDTTLSTAIDAINLLPTPNCQTSGGIHRNLESSSSVKKRFSEKDMSTGLPAMIAMLPTPTTDNGHERSPEYWENREGKHQVDLQGKIGVIPTPERAGMKLQPEFTLWMMGFPTDYLDLP